MMRAASTSLASARRSPRRQPGDVGGDVDGRESRPSSWRSRRDRARSRFAARKALRRRQRHPRRRPARRQQSAFEISCICQTRSRRSRHAAGARLARRHRMGRLYRTQSNCLEDSSMRNTAPRDGSELEALEHAGMARIARVRDRSGRPGPRPAAARRPASPRPHAGRRRCRSRAVTPYVNTILPEEQTPLPGSQEIERRIKSLVRWNAMAMVVRANRLSDGIGGHISTFASAATLYEIGFNHFFRGKDNDGDARHHLLPGPRRARHLRARVPRRAAAGREARATSAASCAEAAGCRRTRTRG